MESVRDHSTPAEPLPCAESEELQIRECLDTPRDSEAAIEAAVDRSAEVLAFVTKKPKADLCTCTLGPGGSRCISQFTDSELEKIR
jgi:hypothetical protein